MLSTYTVTRPSFFTRLDFRTKLFLMAVLSVVAFLWENPLLQAILALAVSMACLVAGVKPSYLRYVLLLMLPFYLFILLTQGFFAGDLVRARTGLAQLTPLLTLPPGWWLVGGAVFSLEGLLYGLNVIFKTLTMTLVIPLGVFTTDVNAMLIGLVKLRLPYKLAFVFASALRFFPLLLEEVDSLLQAQRLRGLAIEELGLFKRIAVYGRLAVPLILNALLASQQLEIALQAKAFSGNSQRHAPRTYLHDAQLEARDYVTLALTALFLLAALLAYALYGIGRFTPVVYALLRIP